VTQATPPPLSNLFPYGFTHSTSRKVARNVKRWRNGDMRRRWCAAGLLVAQSKFRRVKGHKQMKRLIDILDRAIDAKQSLTKTA